MKSPPLQPAGAIGDVIGKKSIALLINFIESFQTRVRCVEKGQTGMGELAQTRFNITRQIDATGDFAMLPRCFKARAVGEAATGKSGIGQLPDEPRIGALGRGFQNKL